MTAVNFDLIGRDRGASSALDKVSKKADETGRKFGFLAARSHGMTAGMTAGFGKIAAAMGAVATISVFKGFIDEARESGRVSRITENVIKSTGGAAKVTAGHVGDLATKLSNVAGVDDEVIQTGANLLLTFKNVRNEVGKGNQVFDRATAAAVDLSAAGFGSIDNASKMLGKALNDPLKGITALGRAGVTFTDQQKKQIKTLVESGKVLEAQKIILKEVESQVGGAAKAAADPMARLGVVVGNVKETLGTAFLPVVEKVSTFLADHLPGAAQKAGEWIGKLGTGVSAMIDAFKEGDVTSDGFIGAMERIGATAKVIVDNFKGVGKKIVSAIGTVDLTGIGKDIAAGAKRWAGDIIGGIKDGLEFGDWRPLGATMGRGLIAALQGIGDVSDKIAGAIGDLVDKIDWAALGKKVSSGLHDMFGSVDWGKVGDAVGDAAVMMVQRASTLGQKLATAFTTLIKSVNWNQVGHDLTGAVAGIVEGIDWKTVAAVFFKSIVGSLKITKSTYEAVTSGVGDLITGMWAETIHQLDLGFDKAAAKTKEIGASLISGLKSGVVAGVKGIGSWLKATIVDPVVGAVKSFFGVHSPSTVFASIGAQLISGLKSGIVGAVKGIGSWIWNVVIHPLVAPFASAGTWLVQEGRNVISGFLSGLSARWEDVKKWVGGIATWIKDHKGPISLDSRLLIPAGTAIMSGFLKGLQSGAGKAWDFVKSVGGKTVAQLRDTLSFVAGGFSGTGSNIDIGRAMASQMGWTGDQWRALFSLWTKESNWNNLAQNPTSSAFGIPQFLNSTAAAYGVLGDTDPRHQIAAGMRYIKDAYGTPLNAWNKWLSRSPHWYEQGTPWVPNDQLAYLHKGEAVVPAAVNRRALAGGGARGGDVHIHLHGTEQQLMNQLTRKIDDLRRQGRL